MICPSCATLNEPGRKFCGECGTKLAVACSSCGTANAPGMRFCGECGTPLEAGATGSARQARPFDPNVTPGSGTGPAHVDPGAPGAAGPIAERRLVTVLFADLVGFTTISEGRDPEEVRELLSRYFDVAREQIERYGGTVEKFIGDAVMAVWGAPTAHEDDAERGVRAALEVVDSVKDLAPGLQARAGVLTGEAAVTVGARGQGMVAGDLVNTASRLQSAAQPGMVLVGETTQRATANAIAYEPAGEQLLKGKATPVAAYRALRVVGERGGRGRGDRLEAPFVGRDSELRLLKDLYHATAREKRVRLVSITGQGGIGKSRLTWELKKYADGVAEQVWWHEGRSPAYGSGITFWALGEMVRARAQLNETDDPATTRTKIAESVGRFIPDGPDRDRVEHALGTLLGVAEAQGESSGELFGAWRLYFERMAAENMVILVFEDLHWADSGLLDFIDHMLEWSRSVPILIVTLARPELLDRRADWGAGRRNFLALDLEPLDEASMRELLAGFVPGLAEAAVRSIVTRAEGIPLYAVETIRMLVADGRLIERPEGGFEPAGELGELAVPETLHALIAARLDGLDPAERSLIQDAAVLGQSFSPAGLGAVSGLEKPALDARLRTLVKSDLLVEESDPRSPERGQYAFVQALIREVAYSTLSLKDRRSRHLAAARFFEALGEDELAGALASHYLAAYRATPAGDEAAALATQARIALRGAAERATNLGSPRQAVAFLEQAIEITTDDAELADMLERAISAATVAADHDRALAMAPQLRELRESMGDRVGAAAAAALQSEGLYVARQRERAGKLALEDLATYEDIGDHTAIIRLLVIASQVAGVNREYATATEQADRALAMAERLGEAELASRLLMIKGATAQYQARLWEAIALTEGARRLAEQHGLTLAVHRANGNLANMLALDDPRATIELEKETLAFQRRLGAREREAIALGNIAEDARRTGEWDWVLSELDRTINRDGAILTDLILEIARALLLVYRGQMTEEEIEELGGRIALTDDLDIVNAALDLEAVRGVVGGDFARAVTAWQRQAAESPLNAPYALVKVGVVAILADDSAAARAALQELAELGSRGRAIEADMALIRAGLAGREGDTAAATAGFRAVRGTYRELGLPWDEALTGIAAATTLGTGDPEVAGWLGESRTILERLGATPLIALVDRFSSTVWNADEALASAARGSRGARGGAPGGEEAGAPQAETSA
ncbi:MAG TPA: adenylate/guanylate cyclase domain-containing protein [Candidatus Limnocylindria bacterium]|nr:adenylate/guanylate cyclase domain-containing protein [Candidatus Limnocylindria bacterium]